MFVLSRSGYAMTERLNPTEYFLLIAQTAAMRSTCPRRQVGAVLVEKGIVVSTGFNGSPRNMKHCTDPGSSCLMYNGSCIRTVHAEVNALLWAGRGEGDTLYCTDQPCLNCTKAIINHGVTKVFYMRPYPDDARDALLKDLGISNYLIEYHVRHSVKLNNE